VIARDAPRVRGASTKPVQGEPLTSALRLAPVAVFAVALAVYLPRVCRTVSLIGDSAVFTSAAVVWGVPQPPGYPLFSLLGHLASLVPVGGLAWRVNATSAIFHAGAAGVVAHIVGRTTRSATAAVGGGLFLAFSGLFFAGSLYAETFPLNDLFTAVAIAAALSVARTTEPRARWASLRVFAVVAGLASAHHMMIALSAPALLPFVARPFFAETRGRPKRAAALGALFLGAMGAAFALVPIAASRDPWVSWGDVHDTGSLARLVLRSDYGGPLSAALVTSDEGAAPHLFVFATDAWNAFGLVGVALAVVGFVSLWEKARDVALCVLVGGLLAGPFFAVANAIPIGDAAATTFAARFGTMAHVFGGIAVGAGIGVVERAIAARARPLAAAAGLAFVVPLVTHPADLRNDTIGRTFARDLFRDLPEGAIVMGAGDAFNGAASYACAVERLCDGRAVFSPGQLHMPWRVAQLERRYPWLVLTAMGDAWPRASDVVAANFAIRPVFLTAKLLDLDPRLRDGSGFLPSGLLLRAMPEDAVATKRAELIAEARGLLEPARCGGCQIGAFDVAATPLERAVTVDYAAAMTNHARILEAVYGDEEDARVLDARAAEIGRYAGENGSPPRALGAVFR
jgi:hypothetical protein